MHSWNRQTQHTGKVLLISDEPTNGRTKSAFHFTFNCASTSFLLLLSLSPHHHRRPSVLTLLVLEVELLVVRVTKTVEVCGGKVSLTWRRSPSARVRTQTGRGSLRIAWSRVHWRPTADWAVAVNLRQTTPLG